MNRVFHGGKMKKIIEFEIKNSPNKLENGKRYLKQTEGGFYDTKY